jgi:DNA-binding beta-propeller fold protein YncE
MAASFEWEKRMTSCFRLTAPHTVAALAISLMFAACSGDGEGGGQESTGGTTPAAPAASAPVAAPAEQPGVFRTLAPWAGSPDPGGAGYRDGNGSAARFDRPGAVAVASDGSLWVSETEAQRIRRIDDQGRVTTVLDAAALAPRTDAQGRAVTLSHPGVMVAAPSGGVFVLMRQNTTYADQGLVATRWAVLHIAPGAEPRVVTAPADATAWEWATSLALDGKGRLWIGDRRCAIWRSDGEVLSTATGPRGASVVHLTDPQGRRDGCSWLHGVTQLAIDGDDRVLFTLFREVRRLESDGRVTTLLQTSQGGSSGCNGMALDRSGRLLFGNGQAVVQVDAAGREQVLAGAPEQRGWFDGPAASARFALLCGVAVDHQGRTVVVDQDNHAVRRIGLDGSVSTIAGLAPQEGYREGTGAEVLFRKFFSVGPGLGGGVVVADPLSGAVRGVDAQQRTSTLAGIPSDRPDFNPTDGPVATATFYRPTTALKTADGSLWIADGDRLRRLGPDGMVRTLATKQGGGQAFAMTLDRSGDVVVAWGDVWVGIWTPPQAFHHFERYSASAPQSAPVRLDTIVPDELSKPLSYWLPRGLCFLADGTLVYTQGPVVLRRAADGTVALLAGSPTARGHRDGPGSEARFEQPSGLACDAHGGVYVADSNNHAVRYIDAQGTVRTVLGTPGRARHRVDALPGELHAPQSLALVPGGLVVATGMGLVKAGF